jgi:hypothetical protein
LQVLAPFPILAAIIAGAEWFWCQRQRRSRAPGLNGGRNE